MSEKRPTLPSTHYSFEQIIGWFARFTPQFKFRLMSMRRQLDLAAFDRFMTETMSVFRAVLIDLGQLPKGSERARRVYQLIDDELKAHPPENISCASGCSACCKTFPKQITDDEADLLASLVKMGQTTLDLQALDLQAKQIKHGAHANHSGQACLFLDDDNRCRVYKDRPSVCRKYHVTSPSANCSDPKKGVSPKIDLMPELIVSAAMSLPDNGFGFMPAQLAQRLLNLDKDDARIDTRDQARRSHSSQSHLAAIPTPTQRTSPHEEIASSSETNS